MTAFFTTISALALIVLAVAASRIDADSRLRATDQALTSRAEQIVGEVTYSDGSFDLGSIAGSAIGTPEKPAAFVDQRGVEVAIPDQRSLPTATTIDALYRATTKFGGIAMATVPRASNRPDRWAALALPGEQQGAVLLVAADTDEYGAHRRLDRTLEISVVALVSALALTGYLLSGLSMRRALLGLQRQEQFLVEAAHELRTPLTTMRLIAGESVNGVREPEDVVRALDARVAAMSRLVSNLLLRARAQAGTASVDLVATRLDQLVEIAVEDLVFAEPELVGMVQVETAPVVVTANSDLVVQVVANLVANARRYGAPPIVITVSADGSLTVADSGPGISADLRDSVLDAGFGAGRGTGTGLAIVAWVAETHHAELQLDETVGGGLTVTVAMPRP